MATQKTTKICKQNWLFFVYLKVASMNLFHFLKSIETSLMKSITPISMLKNWAWQVQGK